MNLHWVAHIIITSALIIVWIDKRRKAKNKLSLQKQFIKSFKKRFVKTREKPSLQQFKHVDYKKLKRQIRLYKTIGYKTVVYTFLGSSAKKNNGDEGIYGNLSYSMFCINAIKVHHHKVNLIIQISQYHWERYKNAFNRSFNFPVHVLIQKYEDINKTYSTIKSLGPNLVINQDWNLSTIPNKDLPFIFINTHPYQEYLYLTSIHTEFMKCLCANIYKITNIIINEKDMYFIEKIKQTLVNKRKERLVKHNEVYTKHLNQFQEFRKKYKKIVLFAYSGLGYKVESGMEEMRRILSLIPNDYLVIFTIHPAFYADCVTQVLASLQTLNEDLDHNLNAEIRNLNPEVKPLEILKSEFPNFITEFDLELKKIHKTPECPSITDVIMNDVDFVMCGKYSKISFIAMECNKPILAYKKTDDKNFSFEVLQLQTENIANYDFSQNISGIYNKIMYFLFTRMMQLPNLQFDKNPKKFQEFINYEKSKRENNICEVDFEFYEKEWQTIEQVYNQFNSSL